MSAATRSPARSPIRGVADSPGSPRARASFTSRISSCTGFSLVEVVVAMLVLTVGLLGLAAGTGWVIRSVEVARIETARSAALQSGIEQVRGTPFDDLASGSATVGDYEVTWGEVESNNRSRLFEFAVVGPGVGPGGGTFAPILPNVSTSLQYRVIR